MLRGEKARDEVGHQRSQRKMSRKVRSESYSRRFPLAAVPTQPKGAQVKGLGVYEDISGPPDQKDS